MSIPYLDKPTTAFLPSGEPRLLSRSLKTSGVIVTVSPVLLLSKFIYPFLSGSAIADQLKPESILAEKLSLDVNCISPLIFAEDFFELLTSINNLGFF